MIAIFSLTSTLHDEASVARVTTDFLNSLNVDYTFKGNDFDSYGDNDLDLIYVRTGGSEQVFLKTLPALREKSTRPVYLLTNGKSNSLAASMEILSYLNKQGITGEILHGSPAYINERINNLVEYEAVFKKLSGIRLGIVGKPSDWLISSDFDTQVIKDKLGIEMVPIEMDEVLERFHAINDPEIPELLSRNATSEKVANSIVDAHRLYLAIKDLTEQYNLSGFTIRCFDLLTAVHNTGCWALSMLNSAGRVAGCEGDVPTLLSMTIAKAISGVSGFQCNPALIDPESGEMTFAHCTIPLNIIERFELDTHYESGIGVGIRGYMKEGPVTVFKIAGDLSRFFVAEGTLIRNEAKPDLCRTQQVIKLDNPQDTNYFLTKPIGNHHVIIPGHHKDELVNLLRFQ